MIFWNLSSIFFFSISSGFTNSLCFFFRACIFLWRFVRFRRYLVSVRSFTSSILQISFQTPHLTLVYLFSFRGPSARHTFASSFRFSVTGRVVYMNDKNLQSRPAIIVLLSLSKSKMLFLLSKCCSRTFCCIWNLSFWAEFILKFSSVVFRISFLSSRSCLSNLWILASPCINVSMS